MMERSLETLIDEVVLGLASDEETARIEALAARDPQVAARLEQARQTFAPLDDTAEALPLPDGLWERIEARLETPGTEDDAAAPDTVTSLDEARNRRTPWRATALGAIAATLLMAVVLGAALLSERDPVVVAVLLDDGGEPLALIESGHDNTTRVTLLEQPDVPSGQVMQVWTKPDEDGPPVSLGLLTDGTSRTLTVDGLPAPNSRQLYEITFEPAGGSPTNLPTGPVLGLGLAKKPVI